MAHNGCIVVDKDAHTRERADKFLPHGDGARKKILGDNAMRLCPRLRN